MTIALPLGFRNSGKVDQKWVRISSQECRRGQPWMAIGLYGAVPSRKSNVPMGLNSPEFKFVTAVAKANIYFEGKVVSHTIFLPDGSRKTLGLIYPGKFHFGTDAAERMEIIAGECQVKLDGGGSSATTYGPGQHFEVAAKSGFDIEVKNGICEYVCSFLP